MERASTSNLAARVADLDRKVHEVARRDRGPLWRRRKPTVFGANLHRYGRKRVTSHEVGALESYLANPLPDELKAVWTRIGAGVGPFYGLFAPADVRTEIDYWDSIAADLGREQDVALPFSLRNPADISDPPQVTEGPTPGSIPIAHHGDTYWSVLAISGDLRGTVWDLAMFTTDEWQWYPARRPHVGPKALLPALRNPPTFLDWYEGWTDEALASLPKL
jgi:hypothetical protein